MSVATSASALIGLDWGTSALRAYRLDRVGHVLESRRLPWGVMNLPAVQQTASPQAGFEQAFAAACGDWLAAEPALPVIACGMVGSAQGWKEAPYVELPCGPQELAARLTVLERPAGAPLHIVPGLIQRGALPNVMRGEETQVLGVLDSLSLAADQTVLVGLPGTHNKWVAVRNREFLGFDTFMTGELFALLRSHSLLGRSMQEGAGDANAFARGLGVAGSAEGALGPLSNIFSSRTLGLTGALPPTAQADYLSGILIGHEVAALAKTVRPGTRVFLCGEADLCRRYGAALEAYGLGIPQVAPQATVLGLRRIAQDAGLLAY